MDINRWCPANRSGYTKLLLSLKAIGIKLLLFSMRFVCTTATDVSVALPQGGVVAGGNVTISTPASNTVQINQSSQRAIINWQTYNVGQQERVNYRQPNTSSISLNRINPNNGPSSIFGTITANGQVWLVNGAGIWFGPTAHVDVAGLLATTADIQNEDFLAGNYHFLQSPNWNGAIINEGYIIVHDAGLAALVGPGVVNNGVIVANMGTVVLGASREFTVDFSGDQLIQFAVGSEVTKPALDQNNSPLANVVSNSGTIIANGGKIMMSAKVAGEVLDNTINMSGIAQTKSVGVHNGEIILDAGNGTARVTGKLIATGKRSGETGGTVKVLGNKAYVYNGATIDVSGDAGGGEVLIGGNAHGAGPEPNADYAFLSNDANVYANALVSGNGGKVVLWSNLATGFFGNISANGGPQGGNGGWIETSGKEYLEAMGLAQANAPAGFAGSWLLDPRNVTITSSTSGGAFGGGNPDTYTPVSGDATVLAAVIDTDLNNGTSVEIVTGSDGGQAGNITVSSAINDVSSKNIPTLTLNAAGAIIINDTIGFSGSAQGLNLTLTSGGVITQFAAIKVIALTVNSGANAIMLNNTGNIVSGAVSLTNTGANAVLFTDSVATKLDESSLLVPDISGVVNPTNYMASMNGISDVSENATLYEMYVGFKLVEPSIVNPIKTSANCVEVASSIQICAGAI